MTVRVTLEKMDRQQRMELTKWIEQTDGVELIETGRDNSQALEKRLSSILLELGIPAHVSGYRFLQEAIRAAVASPELVAQLMHGLYPHVAEKYASTPGRVERAIRTAINQAWTRCKPEVAQRILRRSVSGGYERPTSGELIALVAEQLRLGL